MAYLIVNNEREQDEMFEGMRRQMRMGHQSTENLRGDSYEEGYTAGCKKGYEKGYKHGLEDAKSQSENNRYM